MPKADVRARMAATTLHRRQMPGVAAAVISAWDFAVPILAANVWAAILFRAADTTTCLHPH